MTSSAHLNNQFKHATDYTNNCLFLIRQLRAKVQKAHDHIQKNPLPANTGVVEYSVEVENMCKELSDSYNALENHAKHLPNHMPVTDSIQRMKTLFQEEQADLTAIEQIEEMIDSENWNEANFQIFSFLAGFLSSYRKRNSVMSPKPITFSNWNENNSPHNIFLQSYNAVEKENEARNIGVSMKMLEKSSMGTVVELLYYVTINKQTVHTQKMLFMENCGQIEYLMLLAPHEEWSFYEDLGQKRVDLTKQSRYVVYQKLTTQANFHLMQSFYQPMVMETKISPAYLSSMIHVFGKFQQVFEGTCRSCKKVMKDFLPPLIFDLRNPKAAALHEGCK